MENVAYYCKVVGCMAITDSQEDYCEEHKGEGLVILPVLTIVDYQNAIDACSACNVSGLIRSLNDMIERIWNCDKQHGIGTYFVNHHPIIQLYAYQIAYLSHGREPIEWTGFSDAYKFCKSVVAGEILPDSNWMISITTCYHNQR